MSYYDDFYCEPSEFEQQIEGFKQSLVSSVKTKYVEEMERLRAENAELQVFKAHKKQMEREHAEALRRIEREKEGFERNLKRTRLTELMCDWRVTGYRPKNKTVYPPKCEQCDGNRYMHFKAPSGRDSKEKCPTCGEYENLYFPDECELYEIRQEKRSRGNDLTAHHVFRRTETDDYEVFERYRTVYKGEDFKDVNSYNIMFFDKEACQKYCDWLNKPKKECDR